MLGPRGRFARVTVSVVTVVLSPFLLSPVVAYAACGSDASFGDAQCRIEELGEKLGRDEFVNMRPFGGSLTKGLKGARIRRDGVAVWEEEDYCDPPLAQEREAVLADYFQDLRVEKVSEGAGWRKIEARNRPRWASE